MENTNDKYLNTNSLQRSNQIIGRNPLGLLCLGFPAPPQPAIPHPVHPGCPGGTALAGAHAASAAPPAPVPCSPREPSHSKSPPNAGTGRLLVGCFPCGYPRNRSLGCLEWKSEMRDGEGTFALLMPGTGGPPGWGSSHICPSAKETGTTVVALGRLGHPAGTTVPSLLGRSCSPVVVLAEVRTWSHSASSSLGRGKPEDIVHSSRRAWSPPSAALGRLAEGAGVPGRPSWLRREGQAGHRGWGCRPATASSWSLCTSRCAPSCSETTPGRERRRE